MKEPWNIKTDDARSADSLPTFIIFCEDQVSELIYFKYFETPHIKVNPIGGQKSKMENVIRAIAHCISEDLMEYVDGNPKIKAKDTQIWCAFDRDIEDDLTKRQQGNISFDEGVNIASSRGIKVAWSNDAFELWVLLHFEDVDPANKAYENRDYYYERLTGIFKGLPDPGDHLKKALVHKTFNYKTDLKQERNFRNIVRPEMISKTRNAIARANRLADHHAAFGLPAHQKVPCTLVHELIAELIRVGGKEI
jgi:hypothetical protein